MNQYNHWILEENLPIATLTLNRPDTMNNMTMETLFELRDVSNYLGGRSDIWVVIVQGQGEHFSSGVDPRVITERLEGSTEELRNLVHDQQRCLDAFAALEKVTIARLHGFCIGGGLLLAASCDFRIASKRTIFSLPEVRLGIPILWGTHRISRLVGAAGAKEMIMLGKRYRAHEALKMGMVHQVVPTDELDRHVKALAERFLRLPPRTVGIAKRLIDTGFNLSMEESQALELDALEELLDSPDLHEAIMSYTEKRRPVFTGE